MKKNKIVNFQFKYLIPVGLTILAFLIIVFVLMSRGLTLVSFDPSSTYSNDEVFYLKQIQSVQNYGLPQGFFGYNFSRAKIGTFGTWSPIIAYIYASLGFLFLNSNHLVYYVNLIMILCSFLFLLFKTKVKNQFALLIIFLNIAFIRIVYSGMVEPLFLSLVFIYIIGLDNNNSKRWFYFNISLVFIMTLMRPYFVIMYLPLLINKKNFIKSSIIFGFVSLLNLLLYRYLLSNFTADYLFPLIRTGEMFSGFTNGFNSGISHIIKYIYDNIYSTLLFSTTIFKMKEFHNIAYFQYYAVLFIMLIRLPRKIMLGKWFIDLLVIVMYIGSLLGIILFYVPVQGSRHIYIFTIFALIYILRDIEFSKIRVEMITIILVLMTIFSSNLYYFNHWINDWPLKSNLNTYNNDLKKIKVIDSNNPWDNTIAFEYGVDYHLYHSLYSVNSGIGINLVLDNVISNPETVPSRYVVLSSQSPNISIYELEWKLKAKNDWFYIFERD